MTLKFLAQSLQILGMLPLLAYPAVLVANAMQLAAVRPTSPEANESPSARGLMGLFIGGTTIYPLVVLACRALAARSEQAGALAWSATPLAFLGALAALFSWIMRKQSA